LKCQRTENQDYATAERPQKISDCTRSGPGAG
jgi:hypothetical protein